MLSFRAIVSSVKRNNLCYEPYKKTYNVKPKSLEELISHYITTMTKLITRVRTRVSLLQKDYDTSKKKTDICKRLYESVKKELNEFEKYKEEIVVIRDIVLNVKGTKLSQDECLRIVDQSEKIPPIRNELDKLREKAKAKIKQEEYSLNHNMELIDNNLKKRKDISTKETKMKIQKIHKDLEEKLSAICTYNINKLNNKLDEDCAMTTIYHMTKICTIEERCIKGLDRLEEALNKEKIAKTKLIKIKQYQILLEQVFKNTSKDILHLIKIKYMTEIKIAHIIKELNNNIRITLFKNPLGSMNTYTRKSLKIKSILDYIHFVNSTFIEIEKTVNKCQKEYDIAKKKTLICHNLKMLLVTEGHEISKNSEETKLLFSIFINYEEIVAKKSSQVVTQEIAMCATKIPELKKKAEEINSMIHLCKTPEEKKKVNEGMCKHIMDYLDKVSTWQTKYGLAFDRKNKAIEDEKEKKEKLDNIVIIKNKYSKIIKTLQSLTKTYGIINAKIIMIIRNIFNLLKN
jgi:hypothetical protein